MNTKPFHLLQCRSCQIIKKYTSIIVLGHSDYYPRFGFVPASTFGIKPPFEVPDTAFMALELLPNSLKGKEGTVKYPKEYNAGIGCEKIL